jgi:hypothetical protein
LSTKPRRSICYACVKTHILLPTIALLRRFDVAEAIGEALALKAAGWGHRRIAAGFGTPSTTVRDWLRRFALRAEAIRVHFTALAYLIDSSLGAIEPRGSPQGDVVEAMVVAADCAARRFGPGHRATAVFVLNADGAAVVIQRGGQHTAPTSCRSGLIAQSLSPGHSQASPETTADVREGARTAPARMPNPGLREPSTTRPPAPQTRSDPGRLTVNGKAQPAAAVGHHSEPRCGRRSSAPR